ncbi:HypC/HybG/HupF family hydrogenase formation chaperone [Dehalococcoides mccartyi]|uniref:HypC/HybG/HupF family hydrogenase formation chaperone n=1 Tax=Dehalococcoides mccartyi TaxID=61435 RepID=UPI0003C826AB|nr:HypC/HybG/HupF family hydrogenase formation chaperone [Dehalococcoides mccartyi]AHB14042.1 hydrogenase expression/formation protein HypC [Dehalococcoides mccartyi GY50]
MCLAVPAKIISVEDGVAEVDLNGTTYKASLMLTPEAKEGDYVLLHTGYAIQVIDEKDALETLSIFKQMEML